MASDRVRLRADLMDTARDLLVVCGLLWRGSRFVDWRRALRVTRRSRATGRDPKRFSWADSNSVANTTSAQRAGEVDAEATTEADSGSRDRSAAERRLGRAGD